MRTNTGIIWNWKLVKFFALCAASFIFGAGPARAEKHLSGTYRCVSVEVEGKTKPCSAPAIEMSSDGSYQILAEHGTYEILKGGWLVLSSSKNRGRARLDGTKEIVFEFLSGGKKSKITYRRKFERPPGWVSG